MNSLRNELEDMFASQSFYSQEDSSYLQDIEIEEDDDEVDEVTEANEAELVSHLLLKPDEPFITLMPRGTCRQLYVDKAIEDITSRILSKSKAPDYSSDSDESSITFQELGDKKIMKAKYCKKRWRRERNEVLKQREGNVQNTSVKKLTFETCFDAFDNPNEMREIRPQTETGETKDIKSKRNVGKSGSLGQKRLRNGQCISESSQTVQIGHYESKFLLGLQASTLTEQDN